MSTRLNFSTGFGDNNELYVVNSCPKSKLKTPLYQENYLKEFFKENDLNLLSSNYQIPYMEYDNSYKGVDKKLLYKYINNKLVLSYTSFDNYNRCKFKYYLNSILKINIIKGINNSYVIYFNYLFQVT